MAEISCMAKLDATVFRLKASHLKGGSNSIISSWWANQTYSPIVYNWFVDTKCQPIGEQWACQHLPVSSIQLLYITLMTGLFSLGRKMYPHPPQPLEYAQACNSRAWEKFTYCGKIIGPNKFVSQKFVLGSVWVDMAWHGSWDGVAWNRFQKSPVLSIMYSRNWHFVSTNYQPIWEYRREGLVWPSTRNYTIASTILHKKNNLCVV